MCDLVIDSRKKKRNECRIGDGNVFICVMECCFALNCVCV